MTVWRHAASRLILAGAIVIGLSACGPAETEATFEVVLRGFELVAPLPVTVIDRTGLVVDVDAVAPEIAVLDGTVAADPTDPNVLLPSWLGGMCDIETTLLFQRTPTGFQFVEHTERSHGGCLLAGIGRAVAVHLRSPVAAETVTIEVAD
jgi:hypothetical protein